ncbi:hypothetical protein C7I87_03070 [Mesorhizobium sp. SARCC-RB16n]|nr:hypothetical protein C7I87_03070 [Mesorhizobium sp. SARCC-RB16n]
MHMTADDLGPRGALRKPETHLFGQFRHALCWPVPGGGRMAKFFLHLVIAGHHVFTTTTVAIDRNATRWPHVRTLFKNRRPDAKQFSGILGAATTRASRDEIG